MINRSSATRRKRFTRSAILPRYGADEGPLTNEPMHAIRMPQPPGRMKIKESLVR